MAKLAKYLGIVILSALLITATGSWLLHKGFMRSNVDFFGKMNAAQYRQGLNILLIGSSRTLAQIDPAIIDTFTHMQSYNLGLNGATIKSCYNLLQYSLRQQQQVKAVVVNIDYNMFDIESDPYKDAFFYPYESPVSHFIQTDSGTGDRVHRLRIFDVALYDDMAKYAAVDGIIRPERQIDDQYKGFFYHTGSGQFQEPPESQIAGRDVVFNEASFSYLDSMIERCRAHNATPVLVLAPYFHQFFPGAYINNYYSIINRVKELASAKGVTFLDYSTHPLSYRKEYFYNVNHLNATGAGVYSQLIANELATVLATIEASDK